ncbi:hypothetical protein SAMN05216456_0968 [Devosia crocina]|uniref:Secreted protein n=1 Tax=Devosia crocina TaxID=429728 RepID=A0A1I7N6I6_9HYPH|nr:hypothetical protein [Devosia crocina]SFV30278.1 hypothetical protein SAMN05216456_0968 [Devosia crocina]
MTIKSALSVVALTVAFSGAAFAQGMTINGTTVPENEVPLVQERCDGLANAEATESLSATSGDANSNSIGSNTNEGTAGNDALVENAPGVNEAANATSTIDLETISLQACVDGGFVTM